ncbi:hypothetical protein K8U54_18080 [Pseudomonas fulva]|uniref:hypothetical protein n=1 Tax=Pseudomonas fulva TaxID=47880 RepID=UPI00201D43E4|nr:hypothetical protein [Pseudomonas fulva]UQY33611.1 hypothetical protein K8U54_18080 [Pseudomonas fulva]
MTARRPLVRVGGRDQQLPAGDTLDLPLATTLEAGLMPSADKAKLNGVQNGATANSTDATLLNRANHTGTQPASTVTGLGSAAFKNATLDANPGDVMLVESGGWMGHSARTSLQAPGSDTKALYEYPTAAYGFGAGGYLNPAPGDYYNVLHIKNVNTAFDISAAMLSNEFAVRRGYNGAYEPWVTLLHTGNTNLSNYSSISQTQAAIVAATTGARVVELASASGNTVGVGDFYAGALYCRLTAPSATTFTIPANSSQPIPIGAEVTLRRASNANLTIAAASGVVINPPAGGTLVMTQNMTATLKKVATNEWDLIGQTVAA